MAPSVQSDQWLPECPPALGLRTVQRVLKVGTLWPSAARCLAERGAGQNANRCMAFTAGTCKRHAVLVDSDRPGGTFIPADSDRAEKLKTGKWP